MTSSIVFGDPSPAFADETRIFFEGEAKWKQLYAYRSIERAFVNFKLSQISESHVEVFIERISRFLKLGANLRIADIDGNNPSVRYVELQKRHGVKWAPTLEGLSSILFRHGFSVRAIEFYSKDGKFHVRARDPAYGAVSRSRLVDPRGADPNIQYSALIVDAVLSDEREPPRHAMIGEDVEEVFMGTLNRSPDGEAAIKSFIETKKTPDNLAVQLLESQEFQTKLGAPIKIARLVKDDYDDLYPHFPLEPRTAKDGYAIGPLGEETNILYNPHLRGGVTAALPRNPEYWAALRAAFYAAEEFTAVELGAGFGGWLVTAALAARGRGARDIGVAAVEPDPTKFRWLQENLAHHGVDPRRSRLLRGTVGASDGASYYPILKDASLDWGARAITREHYEALKKETPEPLDRLGQPYAEVKEYSIESILSPFPLVDLLHIDIQGRELSAIRSGINVIDERVRILFVGTHSAAIDAGLIETMTRHGWRARHIWPRVTYRNAVGRSAGGMDGEQVWENVRLLPK